MKPNEYQVTLYVRTPHYVTVEADDEESAEREAMLRYQRGGEFCLDKPEIDSAETDIRCVRNSTPEVADYEDDWDDTGYWDHD
jgi:hypothetical protein